MQEHYITDKVQTFEDWEQFRIGKAKLEKQANAMIRAIEIEVSRLTNSMTFTIKSKVESMIRNEIRRW